MKRTHSWSVCLALGFALLTGGIGMPTEAYAQQNSASERVTVRLCVARQQDYVRTAAEAERAGVEQLVLADESSGRARYRLTGLRESELAGHVGRRVEVAGTVENPRTTPVLTTADGARPGMVNRDTPGAVGVTPDGAAAHEPSDALSATVPAGGVARPPRGEEREDVVDTLPALNAASYRAIDGDCAMPPSRAAAATRVAAQVTTPGAAAQALPAPQAAPQPTTVRGCLARQTAQGLALSPQAGTSDTLVLTKAALGRGAPATSGGGVPGSSGDERGSGTIPRPVGTSGAPADAATLTFALHVQASQREQLLGHVGEQVELVGIVAEERAAAGGAAAEAGGAVIAGRAEAAKSDPAHPSAPVRAITVSSFRAIGGTCN